MLRPESQDFEDFVDGILNITEAQQRVAKQYLEDGSVEELSPPLRALVTIMARGTWEGKTAADPAVRAMFTRETLLGSDWYRRRLATKQSRDAALWRRHRDYLAAFLARPTYADEARRLKIESRLRYAETKLSEASAPQYAEGLVGTLGALGGFVLPLGFGYLDAFTGRAESCFWVMLGLILTCIVWLHTVVSSMRRRSRETEPEAIYALGANS